MTVDQLTLTLGLALELWPVLVSSAYLMLRWRAIRGKFLFWLCGSLVGYGVGYGFPMFSNYFIFRVVGEKTLLQGLVFPWMERHSHGFIVTYWFAILFGVGVLFFIAPLISTRLVMNMFSYPKKRS